jgi:UDPglucose 6-dehydrogenase
LVQCLFKEFIQEWFIQIISMSINNSKVITVIGTGYIGLVTGVCLAERGNQVICIDNNVEKIKMLEQGVSPIFEPGIEELIIKNIKAGRISFSLDLHKAVGQSSIVFLCLPTPESEDGTADLSYVLSMADTLSQNPNINNKIIVNKSTVPVGTGELVKEIFQKAGREVCVVSNPEFLREGNAIEDYMYPERVVIGSESQKCSEVMMSLYLPFVTNPEQIIIMDIKSAEMTKYIANSFLATKISFINETANLCEKLGADISNVVRGVGSDSRIGNKFLQPSIGWGGSCFPKDVLALVSKSNQASYHFEILDAVMKVNEKQKELFANKVCNALERNDLTGLTLGVWGLAFKADTDDIRKSPATEIVNMLLKKGVKIKAFDPEAMDNFAKYNSDKNLELVETIEGSFDGVDALVVLTEWDVFKNYDLEIVKKSIKNPIIVDGRNLFEPKNMLDKGFKYFSIGR